MKENQATKLLKTLFQHCEEGYIEIRCLPSKKQEFISLNEPELPDVPKTQNIYFGVATRDGKGGTKENIKQIPCLWIDIDFKDIPEDEVNEGLKHFPLQPTAKVMSGNGIHVYWLLNELCVKEDIATIESYNRRLVAYFGADPQRAEAASIMRVPGTLNHKYSPPREVILLQCDRSITYELDDFDQYLPEVSGQTYKPSKELDGILLSLPIGPFSVETIGQPIIEGHRDQYLFHVLNQLAKSNTPQNIIRQVAHQVGQKGCNPSLPNKQIEKTVKSALKRAEGKTQGLKDSIREYIEKIQGSFTTTELYSELGIYDSAKKKQARNYLTEDLLGFHCQESYLKLSENRIYGELIPHLKRG